MVSSRTPAVTYTWDGSTTVFSALPFPVSDEETVAVILASSDGETRTVLTYGTDYTVTSSASSSTDYVDSTTTVTIASPSSWGTDTYATITFMRVSEVTQEQSFTNGRYLNVKTVEAVLDRYCLVMQELDMRGKKAVTAPPEEWEDAGEDGSAIYLPPSSERKGKLLAFDSDDPNRLVAEDPEDLEAMQEILESVQSSASLAEGYAETAAESAESASSSASLAATYASGMSSSVTGASSSATAAAASATAAAASATSAASALATLSDEVSQAAASAASAESSASEAAGYAEAAAEYASSVASSADSAAIAASKAKSYMEEAEEAAESAGESSESAIKSADLAASYAMSAKDSALAAAASEESVAANAEAAAESEANAKASEANAKASEDAAATSESNAAASATLAESWAVGGTETRVGEDEDNAKYYAGQSASSASAAATSEANAKSYMTAAGTYASNASADAEAAAEVLERISAVYTYKGSVDTYADLLALDTSGLSVGDTYNVVNDESTNTTGMNYSWTGTGWDSLGSTIDMSLYSTTEEMESYVEGLGYATGTDLSSLETRVTTAESDIDSLETTVSGKQDTLGTFTASGTVGSSTAIPVLGYDTDGHITGVTTATPNVNAVGTGLSLSSNTVSLAASGVTAGTYGSTTAIPAITVDTYGRVTSVSTKTVYPPTTAGTSGYVWTSDGSGQGVWAASSTSELVEAYKVLTGYYPVYAFTLAKSVSDWNLWSGYESVVAGDTYISNYSLASYPQCYGFSSAPSEFDEWGDDSFVVYVNGQATSYSPRSITAKAGDKVRIAMTGGQDYAPCFNGYYYLNGEGLPIESWDGPLPALGVSPETANTIFGAELYLFSVLYSSYQMAPFYGCSSLTSVPSGLFANNTSVTSFSYCFRSCTALSASITIGSEVVSSATYFAYSTVSMEVAVPADSTTYTTFSGLSSSTSGITSLTTY